MKSKTKQLLLLWTIWFILISCWNSISIDYNNVEIYNLEKKESEFKNKIKLEKWEIQYLNYIFTLFKENINLDNINTNNLNLKIKIKNFIDNLEKNNIENINLTNIQKDNKYLKDYKNIYVYLLWERANTLLKKNLDNLIEISKNISINDEEKIIKIKKIILKKDLKKLLKLHKI